jgi:hypothetical protein
MSKFKLLKTYFITNIMKSIKYYNQSFMRMYRILMEENKRQKDYMQKIEVERILKQHHEMIEHINKKLKIK